MWLSKFAVFELCVYIVDTIEPVVQFYWNDNCLFSTNFDQQKTINESVLNDPPRLLSSEITERESLKIFPEVNISKLISDLIG